MFQDYGIPGANKTAMNGRNEQLSLPAVGARRMSQRSRVSIDELGQQLMTPGTIVKYKAEDVYLAQASFNNAKRPEKPALVASARKLEAIPAID